MNSSTVYVRFVIVLLVISLSACSSESGLVQDRALERWHSLISHDWEKAYAFESPSYRATYTIDRYKDGFGAAVEWAAIEFISVESVNEQVVDVVMKLHVVYNNNLPFSSQITERWSLEDGVWWHIQATKKKP